MQVKEIAVRAGLGLAVGAMLVACGSEPQYVSGKRDDVKHVNAQYEWKYKKRKAKRVQVSPEKYCVELDNVAGNLSRNDEWFTVSAATYNKYRELPEGTPINRLEYTSTGC